MQHPTDSHSSWSQDTCYDLLNQKTEIAYQARQKLMFQKGNTKVSFTKSLYINIWFDEKSKVQIFTVPYNGPFYLNVISEW